MFVCDPQAVELIVSSNGDSNKEMLHDYALQTNKALLLLACFSVSIYSVSHSLTDISKHRVMTLKSASTIPLYQMNRMCSMHVLRRFEVPLQSFTDQAPLASVN